MRLKGFIGCLLFLGLPSAVFAQNAYERTKSYYDSLQIPNINSLDRNVVWRGRCASSYNPSEFEASALPVFESNDPILGRDLYMFSVQARSTTSSATILNWAQNEVRDANGAFTSPQPDYNLEALTFYVGSYYSTQDNDQIPARNFAVRAKTDRNGYITNLALRLDIAPDIFYCYYNEKTR